MDGAAPRVHWTPLSLLSARFRENVQALSGRDPLLAQKLQEFRAKRAHSICSAGDMLQLGVDGDAGPVPVSHTLPPLLAKDCISKLYPSASCTQPVMIAGEDMGWLWNGIYQLPCHVPAAPGHRPPLFFLIRDLERFWVILHLHDWKNLLSDERVRLFTGENALADFRRSLVADADIPWPRLSIRVDPLLWTENPTLDQMLATAAAQANEQFVRCADQSRSWRPSVGPEAIATLFRSGRPINVLGITSRFTTFLQYSMRDWLAAFQRLGHHTRLLIESHDHEMCNNLAIVSACAAFKPDLIVIIDHYRRELAGVPEHTPMVMWVQDALPNIYRVEAGKNQQRLDYTIGYGRTELTTRFEYPASRFMPAMVGVNPERFAVAEMSEQELTPYRCDISFVSHATMPAEQIIREQCARMPASEDRRLLNAVYEGLRAVYEAGNSVTAGEVLRGMIVAIMRDLRMSGDIQGLYNLVAHRVNNALFRHQTVRWVARMGVNLHLYGNGWENHPEFRQFARGAADNRMHLPAIYRASAINLQVTPFGAVHQRLLDGISCGGFFLCRSVAADELESLRREIWGWCRRRDIRTGAEMLARRDAELDRLLQQFAEVDGIDPTGDVNFFFAGLEECNLSGFTRTINTLFQQHERFTFSTEAQLASQVSRFLANPDERREIAMSMRQRVLETHTYESITRRMIDFIADDLERGEKLMSEAA